MALDLIVKNGTIVSPTASYRGHVLVKDGTVQEIMVRDDLPPARAVIDATGLHVLPGLIDPHVHFRVPGLDYKEDFETGSRAAACGGITTVLDMPNVIPPTATVEALRAKADAARGRSYVDYGFYGAIVEGNSDQILPLAEAGVVGFKVFLGETVGHLPTPSDGEILDAWRIVAGRASAAGCTPRMRRSPPTYGRSSRPRAARIPSRTWNPGRPWRRPRLSPGPSCWPATPGASS